MRFIAKLIRLIGYILFPFGYLLRLPSLAMPGPVRIRITYCEDGKMEFVLNLPPVEAADVLTQRISVSIGGNASFDIELDPDATATDTLSGNEGDTVFGSFVHIDRAGNVSEAREFEFVLTDTKAPPMPGELTLTVTDDGAV